MLFDFPLADDDFATTATAAIIIIISEQATHVHILFILLILFLGVLGAFLSCCSSLLTALIICALKLLTALLILCEFHGSSCLSFLSLLCSSLFIHASALQSFCFPY